MEKEEAMEILGLSDDMAENIKRAYLRLSRENHPDAGGDPDVFKRIHLAYTILSETERSEPSRQETINLNVQVSLEEAVFGVVLETHIRPSVISSKPMIGNGKSSAQAQMVTVVENIPAMTLLMFGSTTFSHKNVVLGGSERTVNITYSIAEHERYRPCSDKNMGLLEVNENIPVTTALYGGNIEVKTMYGIRKMYVKPGTNVGDRYTIKNHGPLGSLVVNISGFIMPVIHEMDSGSLVASEKAAKEIAEEEEEIARNKSISESI